MNTEQYESHERVRAVAFEMLSALDQITTHLRARYRDRNLEAVYQSARRAVATARQSLNPTRPK